MKRLLHRLYDWFSNTPKANRYAFYFKCAAILMFIETILTKNGTYMFGFLACCIVIWRFSKFHVRQKRDFTLLDLLWVRNRETKDK